MWEDRFASAKEFLFGKVPSQFLVDHASYLVPGQTALSVADGEGRNSVFMAQKGMTVTATEFAPTAIARAQLLATEAGVSVDSRELDIIKEDWGPETYDLVAGIFMQFVGPESRKVQFDKMKAATKPGGVIHIHGYTRKQISYGTGGPKSERNMYSDGILRAAFVGWHVLECREYDREVREGSGHSGMSALIDFVARKPA